MPIYAYKCGSCGHAKDVLQKMSDPLLTVCPACGEAAFSKQVTAAGFQLKGSGWYVTDYKANGGCSASGGGEGGCSKASEAPAADAAPAGSSGACASCPSASASAPASSDAS